MPTAKLPVVTIDGPAGSGKSSSGKAIARLMVFSYRDTGAEYRAVGVLCEQRKVDLQDPHACAEVAAEFIGGFRIPKPGHIFFDGVDLSEIIRTPEGGMAASLVARHQPVREVLVADQRAFAMEGCCVIEGRDAGSVICPEAVVRIYMTASPEVRAARRGETAAEAVARRDRIDQTRASSPLAIPDGADVIDSSELPVDEIAKRVHALYKKRMYAR